MSERPSTVERVAVVTACAVGGVLLPRPASAHLVTTGLGPVYDGVSHVLSTPDDVLPVLALACVAGMNGPAAARRALFMLTLGWMAGGIAGRLAGAPLVPDGLTVVSFLVLGSLTAADRRLPPSAVASLALGMGLLHGWLNGVAMAAAQREGVGLVGTGAAIFVLVSLVAALVVSTRRAWVRMALRVAGSWVAAIGLLMLGWMFRD